MNDIIPASSAYWQALESIAKQTIIGYGYEEIRMPILEKTELFARSIGEVTDIVEKEMYTFSDRNGDSLTLRPEGTAGCVRACIENGLLHNQTQRLWYIGPMFRHERPQKGRYRQFHQVGVEAFGMPGPDIDAELIILTARLWKNLGLHDLELQINSLGDIASRRAYRDVLVKYFTANQSLLDEDSQRRLHSNPLRILDSKNPQMQELIEKAPKLRAHLDDESSAHFDGVMAILDSAGVQYKINERLVRGLDYYNKTVFEWITTRLGAQGTVCAGGRYDGLVEQLGGKSVPAAGFALGIERLVELVQENTTPRVGPHVYFAVADSQAQSRAMQISEELRDRIPKLHLITHCGGGSLKSQFKKADKSGAQFAIILGADELQNNTLSVKNLRDQSDQQTLTIDDLIELLQQQVNLF